MKSKRLSISIPQGAYEVLKQNYKQLGYTTLNGYIVQSAIGNLQQNNQISAQNINYIAPSGSDFSLKEDHEKDHDHYR